MNEYPLYTEALKVYGIKDKTKKLVRVKDIKNSKIWLLQEGHCLKDQIISICELDKKSYDIDRIEIECNSFATLVSLVDDFGGYTLLPELYVNIMSRDRQIRTQSFEEPEPKRQISMLVFRPFVKKTQINALVEVIRKQINEIEKI